MLEVVGIENGALGNMAQTIGPIGANVGVGAHQDAEVAFVGAYLANRLRTCIGPIVALAVLLWQWAGQERNEMRLDADGTSSWSAAAMWCAACLMQIEVDDIEAHIAWSRNAQDGVGVGSI